MCVCILFFIAADGTINLYKQSIGMIPFNLSQKSNQICSYFNKYHTFNDHAKGVSDVSWSNDNRYIVSCSDDQLIIVWDINKLKPVQVLPYPFLYEHSIFTSKRNSNTKDSKDSKDNKMDDIIGNHSAIDYYPFNLYSYYKTIRDTSKLYEYENKHNNYILNCCFNTYGNIIGSGSLDNNVNLWDLRNGKLIDNIRAHSDLITSISFSNDSTILITSSLDGLIRGWDLLMTGILSTKNISNIYSD